MRQKTIIIPAQSVEGQEEDGLASCCRNMYIDSIEQAGALALIVPLGISKQSLKTAFDLADGILFVGGSDICPSLYHENPHPKLGKTIEARDNLEYKLIKLAWEQNKPTLGICRGLQIINVALGGSLFQDIPDQFPQSKITHSQKGKDRWEQLTHDVKLTSESKLRKILESDSIGVNSLHHQAIKSLASPLIISAKSEDGLIEAVEDPSKNFFIAVQWHPEALWQKVEPSWSKLFKAFVEAC